MLERNNRRKTGIKDPLRQTASCSITPKGYSREVKKEWLEWLKTTMVVKDENGKWYKKCAGSQAGQR